MKKWKPLSQDLVNIRSIPDVFKHETPGLSIIKKDYGYDFMVVYLATWISEINSFAGGIMDSDACKYSAELIFEDFYFLKVGDLKLIFQRLKKRKFIRITGNEIYNEIETYFNERCEFAQLNSEKESNDKKINTLKIELNDKELSNLYRSNKSGEKLSDSPTGKNRTSEKNRLAHKEALKFYKEFRKRNKN